MGCRSSPGWWRGRAGRGCRRRAGRCCPAGAAGSSPRGSSARRSCAASSRRRSRSPPVRSGPEAFARASRPPSGTSRAACRRPARPSRACSGRSAAAGSGRRSAGPAASGRCAAGWSSWPPRALKVEASFGSRTGWLPGRSRGSASYRQRLRVVLACARGRSPRRGRRGPRCP